MGEGTDSLWAVANWGDGRIDAVALRDGSHMYELVLTQMSASLACPFFSELKTLSSSADIAGIDTDWSQLREDSEFRALIHSCNRIKI